MGVRAWFRRYRDRARARRELDALFRETPERLRGTSLRAKHCGRTQVLDTTSSPRRILFGIVRHPRPYAFSRQYHEVFEVWCYHVEEGRVERLKGKNLSVAKGQDGAAPDHGGP